jgi:hypothetical protein
MILTAAQQRKLSFCVYNAGSQVWYGKTDRIIENSCIKVYPVEGKAYGKRVTFTHKKKDFILVPLTSVFTF